MKNFFPYDELSSTKKWTTAANWAQFSEPIDPHEGETSKIPLDKNIKIVSAGSCFAQRISQNLQQNNFNYLITEKAPNSLPISISKEYNYGVYTARFGNIYTPRQLLQLFERSFSEFNPLLKSWPTKDNTFIDPFRPRIQPDGFATEAELLLDKEIHLEKVREMFCDADVFIFTLGLTECWLDSRDGAILPACPGRGYGEYEPSIYKFHNMTHAEIFEDLLNLINKIRNINNEIRFIFTVSPVPLAATMTNNHIAVANTYSKSVLRGAAGELAAMYDFIDYFGSYEILNHSYRSHIYWDGDMRTPSTAGLSAVFKSFYNFFCKEEEGLILTEKIRDSNDQKFETIDCDEEELLRHLSR